jgi:hypothetical protein
LEQAAFPLVVYEAAILFESGNYKDFDWISVLSLEGEFNEQNYTKQVLKMRNGLMNSGFQK